MKGKILVIIQFTCLALLMILTNWLILPWWSLLLLSISAILAFWAMMVMKFGNFNIVPAPVEKGIMITYGPYRVIRHPMYASVFIFIIALLTGQFSYSKLSISLVLVAGLVVKMLYEESLLCKLHPGYRAYMLKTKRVIPFVW